MQGLVEFVKALGASRIAAMGAVTIALIGFFVFLIMRVTTPQMTPLFTDLAYEDSAAIAGDAIRSRHEVTVLGLLRASRRLLTGC